MRRHNIIMAVGVALVAAGGCGASQTHAKTQLAGSQCASLTDLDRQVAEVLAPENVERVEPRYRTEFRARAIQPRYVSGATLYVPAQAATNESYLERVLTCHASTPSSQPNDPLSVANLHDVDVEARGSRFVIHIEGSDRASGKEIYERARALHDPSTRVEVKQLGAAPSGANL